MLEINLTGIQYGVALDQQLPPTAPGGPPRKGRILVVVDPQSGINVVIPLADEEADDMGKKLMGQSGKVLAPPAGFNAMKPS